MDFRKSILAGSLAIVSFSAYADKVFLYSPGIDKGVRIAYFDETKGTEGEYVDIAQILRID